LERDQDLYVTPPMVESSPVSWSRRWAGVGRERGSKGWKKKNAEQLNLTFDLPLGTPTAELQKARSERSSASHTASLAQGSSRSIPFSSSSSSSSFHPTSSSHASSSNASTSIPYFPPNTLLQPSRAEKQASLRDALARGGGSSSSSGKGVVSGGKEYGFVGVAGEEITGGGSGSSRKRERSGKDRERDRDRDKGGKVSRWG
jgi:hypothetical protein